MSFVITIWQNDEDINNDSAEQRGRDRKEEVDVKGRALEMFEIKAKTTGDAVRLVLQVTTRLRARAT